MHKHNLFTQTKTFGTWRCQQMGCSKNSYDYQHTQRIGDADTGQFLVEFGQHHSSDIMKECLKMGNVLIQD